MDLMELLLVTKQRDASDLHLTVGLPPVLRLQGDLEPLPDIPALTVARIEQLLKEVLSEEKEAALEERQELDFGFDLDGVARFRCNIFRHRLGVGAAFRLIPSEIKTLAELGLPYQVGDLARRQRGLVLVTGPTGSGKSTTLAAMIDLINVERKAHILTIEDPIEFVHQHKNCMINQRAVGEHTHSFSNALRSALREDPDVILVGEMRDLETIQMAITAAETGHLVLATLHTNDCPTTVDRIIDVFPSEQQKQIRVQLAACLQGVIAQTLIPRLDGEGRVCCMEIMTGTTAVHSLIREAKTHQILSVMQTGQKDGMVTMDQALKQLYEAGLISLESVRKRALNFDLLNLGSVRNGEEENEDNQGGFFGKYTK